MSNLNTIKQQFLQKWLVGLQACNSPAKTMAFHDRKQVIKLSADLAIASTRNGATCWSRAIMAKHVLHGDDFEKLKKHQPRRKKKRIMVGRKRKFPRSKGVASSIARRLIRKRTEILRGLVPGGEFIDDDVSLIAETLDYVSFLRAQVDVMRVLAGCR